MQQKIEETECGQNSKEIPRLNSEVGQAHPTTEIQPKRFGMTFFQ